MPSKKSKRGFTDEVVDATPGDLPPPPQGKRPASIQDTKTWNTSKLALSRIWYNYRDLMARSFADMTREDQITMITKMCVIITVGVTVLLILLFYTFIPTPIRVLGVPATVGIAWWSGGKIVAPVILKRIEKWLNPE